MKERIIVFLKKNMILDKIKETVITFAETVTNKKEKKSFRRYHGRITKAKRRQKVKRQLIMIGIGVLSCMILVIAFATKSFGEKDGTVQTIQGKASDSAAGQTVEAETKNGTETLEERVERVRKEATANKYPEDIIELLDKNTETVEFVENYEANQKKPIAGTVADNMKEGEIPQLYQWDQRWGCAPYGTGYVATCGCGPTCMSMIISGLTRDVSVTPAVVAAYSDEKGYIDADNNTYWTLMQEGGKNWGITCYETSADESVVETELTKGHPIICSVGPGDFTENGHFIVLTGYKDGKVSVNDPFSRKNSEKEWGFADIQDQIKAMWVYSVK